MIHALLTLPRSRWSLPLFIGTLALFLLSACGEEPPGLEETEEGVLEIGRVAVHDTEERTVALRGRTLEVNGLRGNLQLEAHDDDAATWTFRKTARGRDSTAAQAVLDGLTVEERGTEQRYTFALDGTAPTQSRIDVEGLLPASVPLVVRRSSGAVRLSGLQGGFDVEQTHGTIRVQNGQGDIRVRIKNGDIDLDLSVLEAGASVDVETENGNIRIAVPDTASARVDAETEAGRVFSRGLTYDTRQLRTSEAGYHFEAQLHGGNASVRARTTHGSITLQARTGDPEADANDAPTPPDATTAPVSPDTLIQEPESSETDTEPEADSENEAGAETLEEETEETDESNSPETPPSTTDAVHTTVDQSPAPVGGLSALTEAATYPEAAAANDIVGRVYVQTIVGANGSVQEAQIIRGIGYGCDEEALRVVRESSFEPAQINGQNVAARTTVWVQFRRSDA